MRSLMLAVGLLSSVSLAQQKKPPVQTIDLDNSGVITSEKATPLGEIYAPPPKAKFDCLIQVRMKMDDKLRESVHEM